MTQEESPIRCPKRKSAQLTANKKGFGLGKAAAGGLLIGPVGLLGGLFVLRIVCKQEPMPITLRFKGTTE